MRQFHVLGAVLVAVALAGCGRESRTQNSAPTFTHLVSFGDSLSDLGSYRVGDVKAAGGGKYTVNTASGPTAQIWTELMAIQFALPAPCPAQTGLDGTGNNSQMPPKNIADCFSYAQGGAMVTNPVGIGNKNSSTSAIASVGPLTLPVSQQIQNHLNAVGGSFTGSEVVFVWAGGNDFFTWFGAVGQAAAAAAAKATASNAAAAAAAAAAAQTEVSLEGMRTAGTEMAGYVQTNLIGKGARYVVVLSVPDVNASPFAAQYPGNSAVIATLVNGFNAQLRAGLNSPQVLYIDLVQATANQINHPTDFGISNATKAACGTTSGLICTEATTAATAVDTSRYFYADTVHPTPYGHALLANLVHQQMYARGWAQDWLMLFPARFQNGAFLPF